MSRQSKQVLTVLIEAGVALLGAIVMTLAFARELASSRQAQQADMAAQCVGRL